MCDDLSQRRICRYKRHDSNQTDVSVNEDGAAAVDDDDAMGGVSWSKYHYRHKIQWQTK